MNTNRSIVRLFFRTVLLFIFTAFLFNNTAFPQHNNIYLHKDFSHALYKEIYSPNYLHSSVSPFITKELSAVIPYDSICMQQKIDFSGKKGHTFLNKIFNEHAVLVHKKDFQLSFDPLFHFEFGKDLNGNEKTHMNTRGFQVTGHIGDKFSFYSNFQENQASFLQYMDAFINKNKVVPGQGKARGFGSEGYDFAKSAGYISYSPSKYFNIQFGHGKNFIGDGYRSLLLSDNSFNYPYLKITTSVWHLKYTNLYAQFQDLTLPHDHDLGFNKKYTALHYLSWKATKRLSIGLFEAIVFEARDSLSNMGFEINYLNPVIFYRPVEFAVGSPDNAMIGFNLSYLIGKHNVFYAQFLLDEFKAEEIFNGKKWWANKQALQVGVKSYDAFGFKNLYLQTEFNIVRPYTYSHWTPLESWGHYNQPLAHPLGANFRESVNFIKYNYKRFFFSYKFLHALYGEDATGENFGKDVFKDYNTREKEYDNFIGQGIKTKLRYHNLQISYLINPSYNLNCVLGFSDRLQKTDLNKNHSAYIYFGIRTSIENFYYDF